jgi:hypothetical protein
VCRKEKLRIVKKAMEGINNGTVGSLVFNFNDIPVFFSKFETKEEEITCGMIE